MTKQFASEDILNAKEVHLYDDYILYVVDHDDEAYGFTEHSEAWFHKANFWDYFETSTMLSFFTPITKEEAAKLYEGWISNRTNT